MSDEIKSERQAAQNFRNACLRRVNKSKIPAAVAKTLSLILDHFLSPTNYQVAWISQAKLAELQGLSTRSVEWHVKAILRTGLLRGEQLGLQEARLRLKNDFNHTMKGVYAHRLTFYSINRQHPFWTSKEGHEQEVLDTIRETLAGRDEKRTRQRVNPVAGYGLNPVAHDALNPVAGFGQQEGKEGDAEPSPSTRTELDEIETLQEPKGVAFSEERAQPPELIDDPIIRELWEDVHCRVNNPLEAGNRFHDTIGSYEHKKRVADTLEALTQRVIEKVKRQPTPPEIADAINHDPDFKGAEKLSFGWLCSRFRDSEQNVVNNADRLAVAIAVRMTLAKDNPIAPAEVRFKREIDEMRREGCSQQIIDEFIAIQKGA